MQTASSTIYIIKRLRLDNNWVPLLSIFNSMKFQSELVWFLKQPVEGIFLANLSFFEFTFERKHTCCLETRKRVFPGLVWMTLRFYMKKSWWVKHHYHLKSSLQVNVDIFKSVSCWKIKTFCVWGKMGQNIEK